MPWSEPTNLGITRFTALDSEDGYSERESALIDSPGFQEFGLRQIAPAELAAYMPDIRAHAKGCRFYNCTHLHEPGCAVLAAVEAGRIAASRHRIYREIHEELDRPTY